MKHHNNKKAFTLAEVLITLGIIGVVAALTIPTLMANHRRKVTANKLKQTYSIIYNALITAEADNGDGEYWDDVVNAPQSIEPYAKKYILPYIKYTETGVANTTKNKVKFDVSTSVYYIKLVNGTTVAFYKPDVVSFIIDTNGDAGPNKSGYDQFWFVGNMKNTKSYPKGIMPSAWREVKASRSYALKYCGTTLPYFCSAIIEYDGWEIKKDYPYRI